MKKLYSLLVVLFVITISCQKDDDLTSSNDQEQNQNQTTFSENFGGQISRTFLGNVVDNTNNPLSGVLIKIGNQTATTDNNGIFIIQDATVNERFGYVTAEKAGFIHASRAVVPSEGTNKVTIMMLPETIAGSTSSGNQDTISLSNGASVTLQGDYIKDDGTDYVGNVNVILHHLDPTDEHMEDQMPGMLYAADAQNEEVMLQTFGMLAVELRGDNGEDLNLAEGSLAEIRVPLDASLLADAPSTIPLWYFDEDHGYWIEEGQATLIGNEYVGSVTHFSFWNCDIPADVINLCLNFTSLSGSVDDLFVYITSATFGTRIGLTNERGEVCGLVPKDEVLQLEISFNFFGDCDNGNETYAIEIGPFSEDASMTIDLTQYTALLISESITGQLLNCDNQPLTNGYVILNYSGADFIQTVTDGFFEFELFRCQNHPLTFEIQAFDFDNLQQTDLLNYTLTTPTTNIGKIQSCTAVSEYITYDLGNSPSVSYFHDINTIVNDGLSVYFDNVQENYLFDLFVVNYDGIGTYTNCIIRYRDENDNDSIELGELFEGEINVNSEGGVGEFIDLNFSGNMINESGEETPISGSLHVIRDF